VHDWPGREHVETLRAWPTLVRTLERIAARPELYAGAILLGSLSRGLGDAMSDVDLVAVIERDTWDEAWARRQELSEGAVKTFDRIEDESSRIGGHSWLDERLVKVECLLAERGSPLRLYGDVVSVLGDPALQDEFERRPPLTREAVDAYAHERKDRGELDRVEQAYWDLVTAFRQ
jgi:predicted nucleotidyltransferase